MSTLSRNFFICINGFFPPLRMTAFEDLIASDEICEITSGLASKITPKTPIGQDFFVNINPQRENSSSVILFSGLISDFMQSCKNLGNLGNLWFEIVCVRDWRDMREGLGCC